MLWSIALLVGLVVRPVCFAIFVVKKKKEIKKRLDFYCVDDSHLELRTSKHPERREFWRGCLPRQRHPCMHLPLIWSDHLTIHIWRYGEKYFIICSPLIGSILVPLDWTSCVSWQGCFLPISPTKHYINVYTLYPTFAYFFLFSNLSDTVVTWQSFMSVVNLSEISNFGNLRWVTKRLSPFFRSWNSILTWIYIRLVRGNRKRIWR